MSDDEIETEEVEVFKVVLMVVDHDEIGASELADLLENHRYPNHCIGPVVIHTESRVVEWHDGHPLNKPGQTEEFGRLFGAPEAIFSAKAAEAEVAALRNELRGTREALAEARASLRNRDAENDALRALVDGAPLTVGVLPWDILPLDDQGMVSDTNRGPYKPAPTSLARLAEQIAKGRAKFPGNRFMLPALMEEVGELARALLQRKSSEVRAEALDVAAVAIRIFEEGDATFDDITSEESKP